MTEQSGERGFSLLLALWALALLAFLAIVVSQSSSRHARHIRFEMDLAKVDAAASGGVSLAVVDLMAGREDGGWKRRFPLGGPATSCQLEAGTVLSIAVADDAGKVDLNTASERLLTALLAGSGIDLGRARRLAAAIVDFRDGDNDKRPDGAEASDYRDAGLAHGPKNGAFEAVEELALVLGTTREDIDAIAPHITIFSGLTGVDPAALSPELKAVIAKGGTELGIATGGGDRLPAAFTAVSTRRVFTVRSQATAGGLVFHREAVVQLGDDRNTHRVRAWRRADRPLTDGSPATELPPC